MFCILKGRVQNENGMFKGSRAARIRSAGVVAAKNQGDSLLDYKLVLANRSVLL